MARPVRPGGGGGYGPGPSMGGAKARPGSSARQKAAEQKQINKFAKEAKKRGTNVGPYGPVTSRLPAAKVKKNK